MYSPLNHKTRQFVTRIVPITSQILVAAITITAILLLCYLVQSSLPIGIHCGKHYSISLLGYICKADSATASPSSGLFTSTSSSTNVATTIPNTFLALSLAGAGRNRKVRAQFLSELWSDDDPFQYASLHDVDNRYPHSHLGEQHVKAILKTQGNATFWLEVGSMLGGSLILTAAAAKEMRYDEMSLISIDPFAGDVNMWAWEKGLRQKNEFRFLNLQRGTPTIYSRFLANILNAHHQDMVLPIVATSIVGMGLLERLIVERRLDARPEVLYLDSAHEKDETFLELRHAWNLLNPGGILFGDDWAWGAVNEDVLRFAALPCVQPRVDEAKLNAISGMLPGTIQGRVLVLPDATWMIAKKEGPNILC